MLRILGPSWDFNNERREIKMKTDDHIVLRYLRGQGLDEEKDCWIFKWENKNVFEYPDEIHRQWVSKLHYKLTEQVKNYVPRNLKTVQLLFPDFENIMKKFNIMFVVGFPDPYDAMVLERNGKSFVVFDLIQFGKETLSEEYSCHRVLTHELIHICLHNRYPSPENPSYLEDLSYKAFDEGFAHALTFADNITQFQFDKFLEEKFRDAREMMRRALVESDTAKQEEFRKRVDTGNYWDKFASICGKLYLLKHKDRLCDIYSNGWRNFAEKIVL